MSDFTPTTIEKFKQLQKGDVIICYPSWSEQERDSIWCYPFVILGISNIDPSIPLIAWRAKCACNLNFILLSLLTGETIGSIYLDVSEVQIIYFKKEEFRGQT